MNPLLWLIVPGVTVILAACVYAGNGGRASLYVNREVGIDSNISAAVAPASAPSAPSAQSKEK